MDQWPELIDHEFSTPPNFDGWIWWQERRAWYCFTLIVVMLLVIAILWEPNFKHHIDYLFLASSITILLANLVYCLPSCAEWVVYKVTNRKYQLAEWRNTAFWLGLIFSIFISSICALGTCADIIRLTYQNHY